MQGVLYIIAYSFTTQPEKPDVSTKTTLILDSVECVNKVAESALWAVGLLEVNLKSCRKIWLTICLREPILCYPCTIIPPVNQNETSRV